VRNDVTGEKIEISIDELISDLEQKGQWIFNHIKKTEFIETSDGHGFFNGYYNNDGERVDGDFTEGVRMNLTGQVFTTMFGLATDEQVLASYDSCQRYLKDAATGGYKLNTPLGTNTLNFGRGFAFAYGDKENGAIFSHMVIMYMNALYQRGFVTQAYEVFTSMYHLCMDTQHSKIYPGIPEYFSLNGKGMYHYLTGSASWLFLTVLIEMFGVKGDLGDLVLQPKLVPAQFDQDGKASVTTIFAGKQIIVEYFNEKGLDYSGYKIAVVKINELPIEPLYKDAKTILISRESILSLATESTKITITLTEL
ncbi:MAG: cellobiose phosphorylase, partial [Vallitaleaceae bacterium]|nr:cellobiose phosphorylase [Vallitaleaceae bacterium]